jgi:hypothetical protein
MILDESTTTDRFPKRARVKDWLSTEWSLSDIYDPNTHWIVQATNKDAKAGGQSFVVLQTTVFPDQLLIQGSVEVVPETQKQLAEMPDADRRDLFWEIRFGLLNQGVEFTGVAEPLELVMIRKSIWDDALTKDCFMARIDEVNSAVIFVLWTLQRRLPGSESGVESSSIN